LVDEKRWGGGGGLVATRTRPLSAPDVRSSIAYIPASEMPAADAVKEDQTL
jgi:hypothetical protein